MSYLKLKSIRFNVGDIHNYTHLQISEFSDVNKPTTHVFGLGKKPDNPEETPES